MSIAKIGPKSKSDDTVRQGEKRVSGGFKTFVKSHVNSPARPVEPPHSNGKKPLQKSKKTSISECASAIIPFEHINPDVLAYAPIHFYLRPWCDGRYSKQCLRRMLTNVIDQESWHALRGVEEWRALHASNCVLIECLLRALDDRESERAA